MDLIYRNRGFSGCPAVVPDSRIRRGVGRFRLHEIPRFKRLYDVNYILERVTQGLGITCRLQRDFQAFHITESGLNGGKVVMGSFLYRHAIYTLKVDFQERVRSH